MSDDTDELEPIRIAQRRKLLLRANKSFLHCALREVRRSKDQACDGVQGESIRFTP